MGFCIVVLKNSVDDPGAVGRAQLARLARQLRRDPLVRAVRPNHVGEDALAAQTPSTGIKRVFAFGNKALQIDEKVNFVPNADVAVLDGGFKAESDLNVIKRTFCKEVEKVAKCKDGEGDDEVDGHGAGVASVVGAVDNGEGVVGVAPGVRLWSIKVFDPGVTEAKIVAGINYVIAHASEIEVLNMSIECLALPLHANGGKRSDLQSGRSGRRRGRRGGQSR